MAESFVFSHDALEAIEPPYPGPIRVFDDACLGLGMRIGGDGAKTFFGYRWLTGHDRPTEIAIGPFPDVSVEEAREHNRAIQAELIAREGPADDDEIDGFRHPGECAQCLDMTLLNADGLCIKCRPMPPCAGHPELASTGRCTTCGQWYCGECLAGPRCVNCAQATQKKKKRPADVAEAPTRTPKRRAKGQAADPAKKKKAILAALVGVFVLVQGGLFAWQNFADQGPPATAEDVYNQRIATVQGAVLAYKAEKKSLPVSAAALTSYLQQQGVTPPTLTDQPSTQVPDAVVYLAKGEAFELFATTSDGSRYDPPAGKVAPAD